MAIKPYGCEVLFNLVFLFPNLFATLAKKEETEHRLRLDITWTSAIIAITTALNYLLPSMALHIIEQVYRTRFNSRHIFV